MFFSTVLKLIRNIFFLAPTLPKVWRGLVSKEIPFRLKLIPLLGVIYIFSPVSRFFSGVFDDIFVFFFLMSLFISKTRSYLEKKDASENKTNQEEEEDSQTIEGEYRYKNKTTKDD